jgi:hypothetical protein
LGPLIACIGRSVTKETADQQARGAAIRIALVAGFIIAKEALRGEINLFCICELHSID